MYRSMSSEEHFSERGSGPGASAGSASSWTSMLAAVSRPAWSLLQKYLPGRAQAWSSEAGKANTDFGHQLMAGLDNLLPPDPSSPHLRVAYVHCQHENGAFLTSGHTESLSWLTADALRELGIQDGENMHFKVQRTEYRYLSSMRKFLSQVLAPKEGPHPEPVQPKLGVWYESPSTRAPNTWWWQGLWRSDEPPNTLPALYQTKTSADAGTNSSGLCEPVCPGAADNEAERMSSECAGASPFTESADHASLHTARLEFLPNTDSLSSAHEHSIVERQVVPSTQAFNNVAVLTPDQDNGYSSLEEESAGARQCNMNAVCETLDPDSSTASQAGDHGHGGEEDNPAGSTPHCKRVENNEEEEEEEKMQNTEPVIELEALPVQSTPYCQNKAIAYIMGSPCSDESDIEDNSEDDDDGFDSDVLDSYSDSEDLQDSDDEDEEDEEGSESDELDPESERLWNTMCRTRDPYNPLNFTALIKTSPKPGVAAEKLSPVGSPVEPSSLLCSSSPSSPPASPLGGTQKDMESSEDACSSMDEAESLRLWNSFSCSADPYSPLNFQATIRTRQPARQRCKVEPPVEPPLYRKDEAEERMDSGFSETVSIQGFRGAGVVRLKKVTFVEEVEEFYASSDEERHGPWEEYARDRCRFQRRVQEVEERISYCLSPTFRLNIFQGRYPSS